MGSLEDATPTQPVIRRDGHGHSDGHSYGFRFTVPGPRFLRVQIGHIGSETNSVLGHVSRVLGPEGGHGIRLGRGPRLPRESSGAVVVIAWQERSPAGIPSDTARFFALPEALA